MSKSISPKVTSSTVAAALVSILTWGLSALADVTLPAEVQGAVLVIIVFLAGYLTTDPSREV